MSQLSPEVTVRLYRASDRPFIRDIACQTAFFGEKRGLILDDDELLADVLTIYFTDHEPESCFVAECEDRVIGYVIGSCDEAKMVRMMHFRILPRLFLKGLFRGVYFRKNTIRLAMHAFVAWLKGEFATPHLEREYPAIIHINIDKSYRRQQVGQKLMERYFAYIREKGITGIHLATMSESAKNFFMNYGFQIFWARRRTYLHYVLGIDFVAYIMGMTLS